MDSPFLRRVAVTMNFYGFPFERQLLSVFADQKALRAINHWARCRRWCSMMTRRCSTAR